MGDLVSNKAVLTSKHGNDQVMQLFLRIYVRDGEQKPTKPGSLLPFLGDNLPQSHLHLAALWDVGAILHSKFMRHFVSRSCCLTKVLLSLWTGDKMLKTFWLMEVVFESLSWRKWPRGEQWNFWASRLFCFSLMDSFSYWKFSYCCFAQSMARFMQWSSLGG